MLAEHQFSLGPGTDSTDRAPLIPLHSSLDSLERNTERCYYQATVKKICNVIKENHTETNDGFMRTAGIVCNVKVVQKEIN